MAKSMLIAVLYILSLGFEPVASDPNKFVTGVVYVNKNYQVTPYLRKRDLSLFQCVSMCSANPNCLALSYNGLCSTDCNLFATNYCASKTVFGSAPNYKMWDKVDKGINLTCWDQFNIPTCLQQKQYRCAACTRGNFHGWGCQIQGRGCPGKYEFYNGSCYLMSSDTRSHLDAKQQCSQTNGGRLVSIRNEFINRFLSIWMGGATDSAYIGTDAINVTWRRSDNVIRSGWTYQPWVPGQPDGKIESAVVMSSYNWSDTIDAELLSYLCEYEESDCSAVNLTTYLPTKAYFLANGSDGHCYVLVTGKPANFYGANNACLEYNMSLVAVRNMEQHLFLADFLRNHSVPAVTAGVYIGVFVNTSNQKGYFLDGRTVPFDGPWNTGQPDFFQQNVAILWSNGSWSDMLGFKPRRYACEYIAPSCGQWRRYQHGRSDVFRVLPRGTLTDFGALCNMEFDSGGWTVILARSGNRSVVFNRTSVDYNQGFGNTFSDYWLGNNNIYLLTLQEEVELAIALQDQTGRWRYARYSSFRLGKSGNVYSIASIGQFNSSDGLEDALSGSRGQPFVAATDTLSGSQCATSDGGAGWWFPAANSGCGSSNLNAPYGDANNTVSGGAGTLRWGNTLSIKGARMMLRQTTFKQSIISYGRRSI